MVTGMHGGLGFGLDGQRGGGSIGLKKSKEAEEQEGDMRVVSSIWREWRYVTGVGWAKSGDVKGRGTNSGVLPASFWNYHYPRPIGTHKKVVSLWYVVNIVVAMAFTWWLLVRFWVVVSMGSFGGGGNTGCQGVRAQNANGASAGDFDFSVGKGVEVWNQTEWSLSTKMYIPGQFQSRLSLANGYTGASLAAAGPFFEADSSNATQGWPLFNPRVSFATISGFWNVLQDIGTGTNYPWLEQYGWDSFISGIPHPTGLIYGFGNEVLDAMVGNQSLAGFESKLSFKRGVAGWTYVWSPGGDTNGASFEVEYEVFFSRKRVNVVVVKSTITSTQDVNGTITDLLDGRSALRSTLNTRGLDEDENTVYSSVHPENLPNVTGWVVSGIQLPPQAKCVDLSSRRQAEGAFVSTNSTTIGQTYNISLKAGAPTTFYKFVGIASTDHFPEDAENVAREAQAKAQKDGWEVLLGEHETEWKKIMNEETVDDFTDPVTGGLPDDENVKSLQIASVANTFYLLQNLLPEGEGLNDNSISVGGLASDSYAGLIFWDADYWMAPGINLAFPSYSTQFSNYRVKIHAQTLDNAHFNGYPAGSALYSWTSGRYGNCTGTGPCVDYEYHLNYDVAFNLFQQYAVNNNATWWENGPSQVVDSIAIMTGHLLQYNDTTGTYWIHNMTDPDEYANNVDNGAFTIASASQLLQQVNQIRETEGLEVNATWKEQAENIEFPRASSNITLEYQTMDNNVEVKQADVVLLTYPLDFGQGYTTANGLLDLDYYANKQSPNGPAMTYSVFAIDANALSPSGCSAYTYTLSGFLPYLRAPWYQFSEQEVDDPLLNGGTNPAFPFMTGHGGANQVVLFGYLGVRTDLNDGLFLNPSLPPQIPNLRARKFYYKGATLKASLNGTHTVLTRLVTNSEADLVDAYANTTLPFTLGTPHSSDTTAYTIAINQTIILPNRQYFTILTYPDNILQCKSVSSTDAYAPGQFPEAAVDGATATKWQPALNTSSSLTVNTSSIDPTPVTALYFDWGARPPLNIEVYIGNGTGGNGTLVWEGAVEISRPYNGTQGANIVPVEGNTTTVQLDGGKGVWSGAWVRLVVMGCWESDGVGSTVGEFVVVGSGG